MRDAITSLAALSAILALMASGGVLFVSMFVRSHLMAIRIHLRYTLLALRRTRRRIRTLAAEIAAIRESFKGGRNGDGPHQPSPPSPV